MRFFSLSCALLFLLSPALWAGDEDVKPVPQEVERKAPEPAPLPPEPESPDMSLGTEPSPEFVSENLEPPPPAKKPVIPWDPDKNLDYSELLSRVELAADERGVLPPALGFRGYRPNFIAASYGDRTAGFGALVEYSWNRIGAGAFFGYRDLQGTGSGDSAQGVGGAYALYRWLPFDFSPYVLLGLEIGSATPEAFGGLVGGGVEARIYSGWTALLGYTYHSTMRRGFLGGAFGWSF